MAKQVTYNQNLEANEVASGVLDYILEEESPARINEKANLIKVEEALKAQKILEQNESRQLARVLFVTEDLGVLVDGSLEQQHYKNLSLLFEELHVMVVLDGKKESGVFRLAQNIWVYKVYGTYNISKMWHARKVAKQHLVFNEVIRPDIIVADNPFFNAIVAADLAEMFERPWQLHVSVNVFSDQWLKTKKSHSHQRSIAKKVYRRKPPSIRTKSTIIKDAILLRYHNFTNIDVLPQHYNIEAYKNAVAKFDVHNVYKDFVFVMLAQGSLTADSPLHEVFAAARPLLLNPRIGLVVLGDGPARKLFKEKVSLLGIEKCVVFVHDTEDVMSYYKTADVFMQSDMSEESEQSVLRATGAGVPMVLYPTAMREDLFVNGQSAYLCEEKTPQQMTEHVKYLLNSNSTRHLMARNARDVASERLEEDPTAYYRAMRYHIESILLAEGS